MTHRPADARASAAPDDDLGAGPPRASSTLRTGTTGTPTAPGTPRWVIVSGVITLVVALLMAGILLVGRGDHGPGRHVPTGGASVVGAYTPLVAEVHQP